MLEFSAGWVEQDQSGACQKHRVIFSVYASERGRGVAGRIAGRFPKNFAVVLVEGDDTSTLVAADVQHYSVSMNERRAGDSKEAFGRSVIGFGIDAPNSFAGLEVGTGENTFGAIRINFASFNGRGSARTFVEAEIVPIGRGVIQFPKRFSSFGFETFYALFVIGAVEQHEPAIAYGRAAE